MPSTETASGGGGLALICSTAAFAASSDSKVSIAIPLPSLILTHCAETKPGACLMSGIACSLRNLPSALKVVKLRPRHYCVHHCLLGRYGVWCARTLTDLAHNLRERVQLERT